MPETATTDQHSTPLRIFLIDDHPVIRDALTDVIDSEPDLEVCGEAPSSEEALQQIEACSPDVAIVDISLADAHGLDLVERIRSQFPEIQTVVFSMFDENVYAERAIRAGATGYLMKSEPMEKIVDAIRSVSRGEIYLSHRLSSQILSKVVQSDPPSPNLAVDVLTDRELAVFQMLGQGDSIQEIAGRLSLGRKTIEAYRRRAKEKLGFDSVNALLQYAVQWTYEQGTQGRDEKRSSPRPPAASTQD